MVSTRGHPKAFPPPDLSPTKSHHSPSKRSPTRQTSSTLDLDSDVDLSPAKTSGTAVAMSVPRANTGRPRGRSASAWSHIVRTSTLLWLYVSLPLVLWDTGYVLGRPHTMPGGKYHEPIWKPYKLYATIDYLYGFPAIEKNQGFTGAQGVLNLMETALYGVYLYLVYAHGMTVKSEVKGVLQKRRLVGREAGLAVVIGFAAAVMTLSKTILYWLVVAFEDFEAIKHNDLFSLFWLWIVPNGLWIVFSALMSYEFASDIMQGLEQAAGLPQKKVN